MAPKTEMRLTYLLLAFLLAIIVGGTWLLFSGIGGV